MVISEIVVTNEAGDRSEPGRSEPGRSEPVRSEHEGFRRGDYGPGDVGPGPAGTVLAAQRAAHATLHALSRDLHQLALSGAETNVLAVLASHGGPGSRQLRASELADATATKASTLTSVLDRLERRGLVRREVDPADRRSFLISLTAAGRDVAAQVAAAVRQLETSALAGVSPRDLAGFRLVVHALTEAAHDA